MLTDVHSHILPGMDDGSGSVEESLEMLRMARDQGVRDMAATPHFYPRRDTPEGFLKRREAAWKVLKEAVAGEEKLPRIHLGAEVYFFSGISDCEALSRLTIGGKRCILLEMPYGPWTEPMYREIEGIAVKQGLTPVIAHVDRYIRPFRTRNIPERLAELPVLVQANASFFREGGTRRMALKMLRKGQIHVLGSDCHGSRHRRPDLGEAETVIREKLGPGMLEWIRLNEEIILK